MDEEGSVSLDWNVSEKAFSTVGLLLAKFELRVNPMFEFLEFPRRLGHSFLFNQNKGF